jgi:hypothetical protein
MELVDLLFNQYPVVGYTALIALIVFLWWIYANKRPAFPGRIIGILLFYGHLPIGYYRRFAGLMVDITDSVFNPYTLTEFLKLAHSNISKEIETTPNEVAKRTLGKLKSTLESMIKGEDITDYIQVLGTRRDFIKHIWIVVGAKKPIEEYAVPSKLVSFEWAFLSFIRRMAIWGVRYDLPKPVRAKGLGKLRVHIFMPILDPDEEDYKAKLYQLTDDAVNALGYLGSTITSALKLTVENRALKREIKALRDRAKEQQKELARLSKELDNARLALSAKSIWGPTEEEAKIAKARPIQAKYMEMLMSILFGEALGMTLLPGILGLDIAVSVFVGSIFGAFIFYLFFGEK